MDLHYLQLAVVMSVGLSVTANAYADDKLIVTGTDDKQVEIDLAKISQITFNADKMIVATANGDQECPIASIVDIKFDLEMSAIENVTAELRQDVTVTVNSGILTVSAPAGLPLSVAVYNLKGVQVARQVGQERVSVDFNSMVSGIYIVKANNKTIKFTR